MLPCYSTLYTYVDRDINKIFKTILKLMQATQVYV